MSIKLLKSFKLIKIDILVYRMTKQTVLPFPDLGWKIQNETISKRKKKYFIIDKGILIHQSVLYNQVHLLKLVKKTGPVIGDCFTHTDHRGKSIYPFVIHYIANEILVENTNKEVFMIVNRDNQGSIKGIEKAGFKKYASIQTLRWLCFYFDTNLIIE